MVEPVTAQPVLKMVVSFGPGGGSDLFARAVADRLGKRIGRTVIIDSKPGAGGLLAANLVKSAPPDGNTVLMTSTSLAYQAIRTSVKFDLRTDLMPIAMSHSGAHVIYVNSKLPIDSIQKLIEYSKKNQPPLAFGSFGTGSITHIAMELFMLQTGTKFTHVPYKSSSETLMSVLKGETQFSLNPYPAIKPYIQEGRVRPLAVTSAASAPEVSLPGMTESGIPGYDVKTWFGFHAPLHTPTSIVDSLNRELNATMKEPEIVSIITSQFGASPISTSPLEFGNFVKNDMSQLIRAAKQANIVID